jgi:glutamyl-Q tRNA(Asp) synthetase
MDIRRPPASPAPAVSRRGLASPVLRFAPSPNGYLHLGHAYSALLNASLARRLGGRLLLRIEDIDAARCRPRFTDAIIEDLAWLGLSWESPVRRQSEHFADYRAALDSLKRRGLVYPCFCSRSAIAARVTADEARSGRPWPRDPDGSARYPGTCRAIPADRSANRIAAGDGHAWRLDLAKALAGLPAALAVSVFGGDGREASRDADPAPWGDVILARREVPTSYHLSVVVDDALQGVTHVVRGQDLEAATAVHRVLQALLALPAPLYHHHPLLRDEAGDKLAKSRRSETLRSLRESGTSAAVVRRRLGFGSLDAEQQEPGNCRGDGEGGGQGDRARSDGDA